MRGDKIAPKHQGFARQSTMRAREVFGRPLTLYLEVRAHFAERLNHHLIAQMDESPLSERIA